ncbi:MAG: DNA mismatch repair protein MutS [Parabacteroides sp.]
MDRTDLRLHYLDRANQLAGEANRRKQYGYAYVLAQLTTFIGLIGALVACTMGAGAGGWIAVILFLVMYVTVRHLDSANSAYVKQVEALCQAYWHEVKYLEGDFSCFQDGKNYMDPHHAFSLDLDLFGPQSLFHRINRTVTTGGADFLADQLGETRVRTASEIRHRKEVIQELAANEPLCMEFISQRGGKEPIPTQAIKHILEAVRQIHIPSWASSVVALSVALVTLLVFLSLVVATALDALSAGVAVAWGVFQLVVLQCTCSRDLRTVHQVVGKIQQQMHAYVELMEILARFNLKSAEGMAIQQIVSKGDACALQSMRALKRLIDGLDRRGNGLYMLVSNLFCLGDFFLVRQYLQWNKRHMAEITVWMDAVSHFDAWVSMATFRRNEPDAVDAEIMDTDGVVYGAEGLYHPFLGVEAVRNDFRLDEGQYVIITGANMAGKSTFLRSIGMNYILAMNGLPVFANRLQVSCFSLFSSMRTTDDLTHGISYFNAELLRLQQLIETCRSNAHTLIILDEILKGTNSADKLNGSRMFLEAISQLPVTGVIATHDLELSKMAETYPDRFHTFCFEIELSDQITYSYKITPGVAHNQNATYLLKRILQQALLCVLLLCGSVSAFAQQDEALPFEQAYKRTYHIEKVSPSPTYAKLFYDDRYIYVGIYCKDAVPELMNRFIGNRDDNSLGDLVSIMCLSSEP